MATLMGLTMMAKPVDPDRAVQVARNFVAQYVKGADQMTATVVYTHPMQGERSKVRGENGERPAMYVVNIGNMFVIVAADDVAHPVLGYSLSRPWPVQSENGKVKSEDRSSLITQRSSLPPQVSSYLDDLAGQIESAAGQQSVPDRETTAEWRQLLSFNSQLLTTNPPDSVGPLLTTTWDQGQYYNALCPADPNGPAGHVPTGCVATAMAQIINYWGYPVHGRGIHSYNSNYGTLSVNYDSANYDYTNMPNVLTASSTPAQVNAVAMLMRDCGVAANMSYGSTESSSYDVDARAGLINFFRISPDASYAEKCLFSNVLWDSIIRADIATHRPVMYSGRGNLGGHAFVLDGYKQDGYFHFNFGWSGYADGWYLVDAITIGGYSFNNGQSALFGIFPDSTGNIILPGLSGISLYELNEPLFFLDFLGNNKYIGQDYTPTSVRPNSISQFYLNNEYDSIVVDILNYEGQSVLFHDGISNEQLNLFSIWSDSTLDDTLLFICGGYTVNTTRPVVSTTNAISLSYYGYWSYDGFKMRVSKAGPCRIPSELQCMFENGNMNVSWQENGSSTMWQIEYGLTGYQDGEGIIITCDSLGTTIQGLEDMHIYDFRVRAICSETEYSEWSEIVTARVGTYWDDIVTEEPAGFSINNQGEILVSSPEALAWICKLKHMGYYSYATVKQTADIDLGGHWWRPISYFGVYDGQNHSINNLTVYEPQKQTGFGSGFFGNITDGMVINLTLESPVVLGCQVGGIAGYAVRSSIVNCAIINGNVKGTITGSIIGWLDDAFITNCYTSGLVAHRLELKRSGTIGGFCGCSSASSASSWRIRRCTSTHSRVSRPSAGAECPTCCSRSCSSRSRAAPARASMRSSRPARARSSCRARARYAPSATAACCSRVFSR